jgi:hypothetical protein
MNRIFGLVILMIASHAAFGQTKPRQATIAQQKMCADQARKTFNEDNPTRPEHAIDFEYTSHYEASANVCYIMTHTATVNDKSFNISYAVYDAFEGRGYGSFISIKNDVMECYISRPGHDRENCKSSDEFEQLVDKYFGIGR